MTALDRERLGIAAGRFAAFFRELASVYAEREEVLKQIALALLSREHVLLCGPPGTAKSHLASAVLNRILDEETGRPSVFARQLTESTVQTDLIGPVDFKTLMTSGRTEHFTDEGMLGAVHAFLDEVLDGRDMLLRAALNLLQERELKQGHRITRGAIECAVMTTNRYPAEVVEQSRETLLAFMDRIAYVGFVPRGFAEPAHLSQVLTQFVGGTRPAPLQAGLTIQDLDALQAAADAVYVAPELCERMGQLVRSLDEELAAAARADRTFVPTRYLSTRSAVRLGRTLRAAVVYTQAMGAERSLEARANDFEFLRFALLLCGPTPEQVGPLLRHETDPRERRQLNIVRTEREVFDRCLQRLPAPDPGTPRPRVDVARLQRQVREAGEKPEALAGAARQLASAIEGGRPGAEQVEALLQETIDKMVARGLEAGLTAGSGLADELPASIEALAALAQQLDELNAETRGVARWLRGRAAEMLAELVAHTPTAIGSVLERVSAPLTVARVNEIVDAQLDRVEVLAALRARLQARGAATDRERAETAWQTALGRLEDELCVLWDDGFRAAVSGGLAAVERGSLAALLHELADVLGHIERVGTRLEAVGGRGSVIHARVVGPRLAPMVEAAFRRFDARDRYAVVDQVDELLKELEAAGLAGAIAPSSLMTWSAEALIATERPAAELTAGLGRDHAGYRELRQREQRVALSFTLVGLALRLLSPAATPPQDAPAGVAAVAALVAELPVALIEQLAELDLARLERAVALLEAWWRQLARASEPLPDSREGVDDVIESYVRERFFHVTVDEAALARYAIEARVVAEVFPGAAAGATEIGRRVARLEAASTERLLALFRRRSDAEWVTVLGADALRGEG